MTLSTIDPKTALLIVDLQKGIAGTDHPVIDAVVDRSARLAGAFRAAGQTVVLINVAGAPGGRTESNRGAAPVQRPAGWTELRPELERDADDVLITKHTWGAFHGTDLDAQLRERGVTQVFVTGIATSKGVESTARGAHEHGYHVVLVTDAMFDRDSRAHESAIELIFPQLGEVTTTAEVLDRLG
ncbi:isochorismatase family protein [Brevibacterium sp. 50QC2O2]|jgi:nicotinamidase-related amidase|uniref:isochorismatase family protein n=1 Tax=Brevibacterium TaxID=1696 RepID=UPI00211C9BE3|nr:MULTISPECIES: isochorismatase family protein [unclassified Brevibacterium]MCQ9387023.1 isochorismatase family protein [Brevibacterium sp. 68QC2CO]MCQ9387087.1 isochorismatase family protein [Brevibacterium sp. 50QC2O2]